MHTSTRSQACNQARSAYPPLRSANRCVTQHCSVPGQKHPVHRSLQHHNERLMWSPLLSRHLATPELEHSVRTMATQHGHGEGAHAHVSSDTHQETGTQLVKGLSQIAGQYKALLLDQFGVLHDGRRPYPGAIEAVAAAAASGLKLLIISNSSRRSTGTLDKLAKMGFDKSCFAGVVTSGELAHRYLTSRPDAWWAGLGTRVLHINWSSRGVASLEGYGLEVVTDPRDADFILAHGTEGVTLPPTDNGNGNGDGNGTAAGNGVVVQERSVEQLQELLAQAARVERGGVGGGRQGPPPMVVANPDLVTVDGDDLITMPGTLAAAYGAAGGHVVLMGKPAPLIYEACGELLGLPAAELLAVGDSLEHDIAGAAAAGINSLFVAGGIHARELIPAAEQQQQVQGVDMEALRRLCRENGRPAPTYALARLVW